MQAAERSFVERTAPRKEELTEEQKDARAAARRAKARDTRSRRDAEQEHWSLMDEGKYNDDCCAEDYPSRRRVKYCQRAKSLLKGIGEKMSYR